MLGQAKAIGSFSTDAVERAAAFYGEVLGIDVAVDQDMGPLLTLTFPGGTEFLVYEKEDHQPATHTVVMLTVEDLDDVTRRLVAAGVTLEQLEWTDPDGIARDPDGNVPDMAWIRDPAGNWVSIMAADA